MEKVKRTKIHGIVCVILVVLIWCGYFFAREIMNRQVVAVEDNFTWVFQVESLSEVNGEIFLEGFAFELNEDVREGKCEIVLQDVDTKKNYFSEVKDTKRKDVNGYFLCEYDYTLSGFIAMFKDNEVSLNGSAYEVLLRPDGSRSAYRTGTFISEGKIVYANPREFYLLDVEGTELKKVVENGILRVARPDYGMYVYQYKGELYWVADEGYGFVDDDSCVQYQLETTQNDRLPEYRKKNNWDWDNLGFMFQEEEMVEENWGRYRVAKKALPEAYSITKIWTGNYIDEWIWKQYFRPYYVFDND